MRQILWFRRDLRITDNALLANGLEEVLPIFIFDKHILSKLPKEDKRVSFLVQSVQNLKKKLKRIGLDLAVFYDTPENVFKRLKNDFDEVLCSIDFDEYAQKRDEAIEKIIPMKRFIDSFILDPREHHKSDGTPYKMFTPFYKSLNFLTQAKQLETAQRNKKLKLYAFEYNDVPSFKELGFIKTTLPNYLTYDVSTAINAFKQKIEGYEKNRDFFFLDATSSLSVFLRFGIVSPKEVFNHFRPLKESETFIKELFWREFYNVILFHFPLSQWENFNQKVIQWNENEEDFNAWCKGETGVPLVDAAMKHLNRTGEMHNRLRMITASFLTKNLLVDWRKGERYFALKLLDYEASSNIGSWQWSASTGADAVPYFRIFNPYTQSKKFDKEGLFIKSVFPQFKEVDPKYFHRENGVQMHTSIPYSKLIARIHSSRQRVIQRFKQAAKILK